MTSAWADFTNNNFEIYKQNAVTQKQKTAEVAKSNAETTNSTDYTMQTLETDSFVHTNTVAEGPVVDVPAPPPADVRFDTTDERTVLSMFNAVASESELASAEIIRNSNGDITDIYLNNTRYSLRYDQNGNLARSIVQQFDDNNNVVSQTIKELEPDSSVKKHTEYTYQYDENGTKIGETKQVVDPNKMATAQELILEVFHCRMNDEDIRNAEIITDSKGNITDIYLDNVRYGIRYDENGNITKTIQQNFEDGDRNKIISQTVETYENGEVKKTSIYTYKYDEDGNRETDTARHTENSIYGNPWQLLADVFDESFLIALNGVDTAPLQHNVQGNNSLLRYETNQDGKVTDMYIAGKRYSIRYDEDGNMTKTIVQNFDEDGNVSTQTVKEYNADGTVKNHTEYTYEYDENGTQINQTRTPIDPAKENALNKVKELYAVETFTELSNTENETERLDKFMENDTIRKLNAAGVSAEEMGKLLNELFPTLRMSESILNLANGYGVDTPTCDVDAIKLIKDLYACYGEDAPILNDNAKAIGRVLNMYDSELTLDNSTEDERTFDSLLRSKTFDGNDTSEKLRAMGVPESTIETIKTLLFSIPVEG